jgi:transposase
VLRRRLRRAEVITFFARLPKALVGIEACPGGHHWARELRSLGHDVRLIPPQYVRPFVKTNKNDAADAEGICEAVVRPNMRFVPIKSVAQQAAMMLHRTRALLLRQRTQLINAVRGHLAEFGLIARRGAHNIQELTDLVRDTETDKLPDAARAMLVLLLEQIREAQLRVRKTEQALEAWAKQSDACRRLLAIPGVGSCPQPRSSSRWMTPSAFAPVVTSRPGSGLYHDKVRAAIVRFSVGSANAATAMSAHC